MYYFKLFLTVLFFFINPKEISSYDYYHKTVNSLYVEYKKIITSLDDVDNMNINKIIMYASKIINENKQIQDSVLNKELIHYQLTFKLANDKEFFIRKKSSDEVLLSIEKDTKKYQSIKKDYQFINYSISEVFLKYPEIGLMNDGIYIEGTYRFEQTDSFVKFTMIYEKDESI